MIQRLSRAHAQATATAISQVGIYYAFGSALLSGVSLVLVRMLGTSSPIHWRNVCFVQGLGQVGFAIPVALLAGQHFTVMDFSAGQAARTLLASLLGAGSNISMTWGVQREKSVLVLVTFFVFNSVYHIHIARFDSCEETIHTNREMP